MGPAGTPGAVGPTGPQGTPGGSGPGQSAATALASCLAIFNADAAAGDGVYWINPDGAGGLRPFQVHCDMTGGGWTRVDEISHFGFAIYTEGSRVQSYNYTLSAAQINAIKAISTQGKQDWQCQSLGIGNAYPVVGWNDANVVFATCWDPGNSAYLTSSGAHTALAELPFKHWVSTDCGDATEACQHNVAHAFFR